MISEYLQIEQSFKLDGQVSLYGAKNAVLVIMASLLLTNGKSILKNVPGSNDILCMIKLLEHLGADVIFDSKRHTLEIDTTRVNKWFVEPAIMQEMRASVLVMGPLLVRFGRANIALPGGCTIGPRPVDYHLKNFAHMGVLISQDGSHIHASVEKLKARRIILEYPSVGTTENIMMAATLTNGTTKIINAALEPEVLDLILVLQKMGARITIHPPAIIEIEGVEEMMPIEHDILPDRLEAGALLMAAAITGGSIILPNAKPDHLDVLLYKLEEMGHQIITDYGKAGIALRATPSPKAVSFKTAPYPGFPTDLQAPMMALQCVAQGISVIEETVFENRLVQAQELAKMGAKIKINGCRAEVTGTQELYGAHVIAPDIRASCALVLAGLVAKGTTIMTGLQHWYRAYDSLEEKLTSLGASTLLKTGDLSDFKPPRPAQQMVSQA